MDRKQAIRTIAAGAMGSVALPEIAKAMNMLPTALNNNINHSVCQWCYGDIPLDKLCEAARGMGIKSIDLLKPEEWSVAQKYGLTCAMAYASGYGLTKGFSDISMHGILLKDYSVNIPRAAAAGLKNVICFSGNANGVSYEQGLENCAKGLEPVLKIAAANNITLCMELLNSKVDHKDYQCNHTEWGVKLCEKLGSPNFRLLYDIYHMQIMEGDVIATIQRHHQYIGHYHTAGVPGRHELDEKQELYYPAIIRAILDTGYQGYLGQEFIPAGPDALAALRAGVKVCDV